MKPRWTSLTALIGALLLLGFVVWASLPPDREIMRTEVIDVQSTTELVVGTPTPTQTDSGDIVVIVVDCCCDCVIHDGYTQQPQSLEAIHKYRLGGKAPLPTPIPTERPRKHHSTPIMEPTPEPTPIPTIEPTPEPSDEPTSCPTDVPTSTPTVICQWICHKPGTTVKQSLCCDSQGCVDAHIRHGDYAGKCQD